MIKVRIYWLGFVSQNPIYFNFLYALPHLLSLLCSWREEVT
jgi:hypothetical protein